MGYLLRPTPDALRSDDRRGKARFHPLRWLEERSPAAQPFIWFGGLIAVGSILLALPFARTGAAAGSGLPGAAQPVFVAPFMATSAVCVTGLAVVPVHEYYTRFGQAVLLALIEMGGLGLMTFATVGFQLFRRRLSLASQAAIDDMLFQRGAASEFRRTFARIVKVVIGVQALGAVCLFAAFLLRGDYARPADAAWSAVFHAVSAFCNAGLTLWPDSLQRFAHAPAVIVPIAALIILGGIGHAVLVEVHQYLRARWRQRRAQRRNRHGSPFDRRPKPLSLHARVVLWFTLWLGVGGAAGLWLMALHGGWDVSAGQAVFQGLAARTAGMDTVPLRHFGIAGLLFLSILMFIGGSPGSCAGGIKTTTFAIILGALVNGVRGKTDVTIFGRVIPPELVTKARMLIGLSIIFNVLGVMVLCLTDAGFPVGVYGAGDGTEPTWNLVDLLVEHVSAFGTVGLSTGVTPTLSPAGRLWLMFAMFLGRLGPLSIALWIIPTPKAGVRGAHGRVMIG